MANKNSQTQSAGNWLRGSICKWRGMSKTHGSMVHVAGPLAAINGVISYNYLYLVVTTMSLLVSNIYTYQQLVLIEPKSSPGNITNSPNMTQPKVASHRSTSPKTVDLTFFCRKILWSPRKKYTKHGLFGCCAFFALLFLPLVMRVINLF